MVDISFIIPVYNAENWIKDCVESIIQIEFFEREIILVNDGSKDTSEEKCLELSQCFPNVIYISQENRKQGSARNNGLLHAKGKYIMFVDADDKLLMFNLRESLKFMSDNELDLLGLSSQEARYPEGKHEIKKEKALNCQEKEILSGKEYILKYGYSNVQPMVWLYIYRKEYLKNNLIYFMEDVFFEDCDFTLRAISLCNKLSYIDSRHYSQFLSHNSTIRGKSVEKAYDLLKVSESIYHFIGDLKEDCYEVKRILYSYCAYLTFAAIECYYLQGGKLKDFLQDSIRKECIKKLRYNKKYFLIKILLEVEFISALLLILKFRGKKNE